MKSLIAMTLLLVSASALAADRYENCSATDYKVLSRSLDSLPVKSGAQFKNAVQEALIEEMGPSCQVLVTEPRLGIPGDHTDVYKIGTAQFEYTITVKSSVESPGSAGVTITRKTK